MTEEFSDMKKYFLIVAIFYCVIGFARVSFAEISVARGEIQQFYETRSNDWSSYVLIKDSFNKELKFFVHPKMTLIRRGSQIEDAGQLTGGMKVTVLYRTERGSNSRASVIQIDGTIRV